MCDKVSKQTNIQTNLIKKIGVQINLLIQKNKKILGESWEKKNAFLLTE